MAVASISCPHLYTLDPSITTQLLIEKKQDGVCEWCPATQSSDELWLCLHTGCLAVLCGESALNHSSEHNLQYPAHMLVLNLNNYRVWCCICEMEVTQAMRHQLQLHISEGEEGSRDEEEDVEVGESASTSSPIPYAEVMDDEEVGTDDLEGGEDDEEEDIFGQKIMRGMVGLRNLGLTCYMNAALQVLSNSPGFAGFFLGCGEGAVAGLRKQPALVPVCRDLMRDVWRRRAPSYVVPHHLHHTFKQLHPMFRSFTQQDSQEFLRYFLDELHDELREPLLPPPDAAPEEEGGSGGSSSGDSEEEEEELCSATGSRSSLCDGLEGLRRGLPARGAAEKQQDGAGGEGGAESEEGKYETCDSGVSGDDSDYSGSGQMSDLKARRKNRHHRRSTANLSSRSGQLQGDGRRPCDRSDGPSADSTSRSSRSQSPQLPHSPLRSSPHFHQSQSPSSPRSQSPQSCPSPPLLHRQSSSPRSLSPLQQQRRKFSSPSPHRPQSLSPHRSPAPSSPRSQASSSARSQCSPKGNSRVTSRTSGLGSSKPSLLSTDTYTGSAASSNTRKRRKKATSGGGGSKALRGCSNKKTPQQQYSGSVVSDLFDGQLISSVQCLTCNNLSSRRETFQDLSLPIPSTDHHHHQQQQQQQQQQQATAASNDGWMSWMWQWVVSWVWGPTVSLHHCLGAFFSADELKGDNMYSCEKCGKLRNGLKYSKVVKLPEVLVVHLKRFRHDYMFSSKIGQHVGFPLTGLSLQPFLHRDCVSDVRQYSLYGVICHHGSVGGGHYTAFVQNSSSEEWYEFDDECVTRVSADTVQRCQAYVLFYKKANPEADVIRSRANVMQVSARQPSLLRFYISKQWFNKFMTFAECGPIDNSDFLCPHGGVKPKKAQYVGSLVKVVRENTWEYLRQQFGGDPPCTRLYTCYTCTAALRALVHRQHTELCTFRLLNSKSVRVFGVAMTWFREWEKFVLDRSQLPPGSIDNSVVFRQYQQRQQQQLGYQTNIDYITITDDCWRFLQNSYGGGPELCLQPGYQASESAAAAAHQQMQQLQQQQQYQQQQNKGLQQHHHQQRDNHQQQQQGSSSSSCSTDEGEEVNEAPEQQQQRHEQQDQQSSVNQEQQRINMLRQPDAAQPLYESQEVDYETQEMEEVSDDEVKQEPVLWEAGLDHRASPQSPDHSLQAAAGATTLNSTQSTDECLSACLEPKSRHETVQQEQTEEDQQQQQEQASQASLRSLPSDVTVCADQAFAHPSPGRYGTRSSSAVAAAAAAAAVETGEGTATRLQNAGYKQAAEQQHEVMETDEVEAPLLLHQESLSECEQSTATSSTITNNSSNSSSSSSVSLLVKAGSGCKSAGNSSGGAASKRQQQPSKRKQRSQNNKRKQRHGPLRSSAAEEQPGVHK